MINENTQDTKEHYYNKKPCSARVVAENCYGMLKGRFRIVYNRCECKLENLTLKRLGRGEGVNLNPHPPPPLTLVFQKM